MIGIILSAIAALLLLALAAYSLVRKRDAAQTALSGLAVLLAGVEVFDQLAVHAASDPDAFKSVSLFLESLLPAASLSFTLTYGRGWPVHANARRLQRAGSQINRQLDSMGIE